MEPASPASLPPAADAELALSLERAHRETRVLDRLGAVWALLLAKCCLLQAAILRWEIPVRGILYVWILSFALGAMASFHYLRAHRAELALVPFNLRVGALLLLGLAAVFLGAVHATFSLGLAAPAALAALFCALGAVHALVQGALRRQVAPVLGAVAWWVAAWQALGRPDDLALACVGAGCLLGQALPGFALARAADARRA